MNNSAKVFGHKSLLVWIVLYSIPVAFYFPDKLLMVIAPIIFFVVAFNAWSMPLLKRIRLSEEYPQCRSIYGLGKKETIYWNEVTSVRLHHLWWGKIDYRILYIHKTRGRIYKINITSYFWFERKALMKALEKYTTVTKDPIYPLPKFKDLL